MGHLAAKNRSLFVLIDVIDGKQALGLIQFVLRCREYRIALISCALLTMLMRPTVINTERKAAVISREFSLSHSSKPDNAWSLSCPKNVNKGTSIGVERINTMVTTPLMMPATNATNMAIL